MKPQTSAKGEGAAKNPPRELLSIRAYAERRHGRGLAGGTHTAVRRAIADGRIEKAVVVAGGGKVRIDPAVADLEWEENTDPMKSRGPHQAGGPTQGGLFGEVEPVRPRDYVETGSTAERRIRSAQADRLNWQAKLSELAYRQKSGELVRTAKVELNEFLVARDVRDQVRGLADKLSPMLAAETDPHRVRTVLLGAFDAALRQLAEQIEAGPPAIPGPGSRRRKAAGKQKTAGKRGGVA